VSFAQGVAGFLSEGKPSASNQLEESSAKQMFPLPHQQIQKISFWFFD
jgi:hypothetical protein